MCPTSGRWMTSPSAAENTRGMTMLSEPATIDENAVTQRVAQLDGCALDPLRRGVAEREQRTDAEHPQEKGQRVERRAISQVAVDEDDGALLRPSCRPLPAGIESERIEQRRGRQSQQLPADEPRCRSG